jgi:hypothetical protein
VYHLQKGDTGTAATIYVGNVTTGAAGSEASVTNSGDDSNAVFDFTIPRGDKGDKGDAGPAGSDATVTNASVNAAIATDEAATRAALELGNVDNTSDATKNAATATLTNKTLTNPTVNDYTEGTVSIGNSGASQTISLASGTFQTMTMTANCTVTMPTATAGKSFILKVLTGAGSYVPTFTGVKWPDNTAPTCNSTASRYYFVTFQADGTAWSGQISATYHV